MPGGSRLVTPNVRAGNSDREAGCKQMSDGIARPSNAVMVRGFAFD